MKRMTVGPDVAIKPPKIQRVLAWELSTFDGDRLVTIDFPSADERNFAAASMLEAGKTPVYLTARFA